MKARWKKERRRGAEQCSRASACLGGERGGDQKEDEGDGKGTDRLRLKGCSKSCMETGRAEVQPETGMGPASALASWSLVGSANLVTLLSSFLAGIQTLRAYHTPHHPNSHALPSRPSVPILTSPTKAPAHPFSRDRRVTASSLIASRRHFSCPDREMAEVGVGWG